MAITFCLNNPEGSLLGASSPQIVPETDRPGRRYAREDCLSSRAGREPLREQIADYVLLSLGAPRLKVELDKQQLSLCVDEALRRFEEYAPSSAFEYYYFQTTPGVSRYEMPCDVGLVRGVYWNTNEACNRADAMGGAFPIRFGDGMGADTYGFFSGFTPQAPVWGRMGEWTVMKSYQEMYSRMTSSEGSWTWGPENVIILFPNPAISSWVIVHYLQRMREWDEVFSWMQDYALAHAKEILGRVRSKFSTLPGPGGGASLDGQQLLSEAKDEKEKLREDLYATYAVDHMVPIVG